MGLVNSIVVDNLTEETGQESIMCHFKAQSQAIYFQQRPNLLPLEKVGDVSGHLVDLGVVISFQLSHRVEVILGDEIDGNTLSSETTRTPDSVDVLLEVARKIIVNNQRYTMDINTTSELEPSEMS